MTTIDHRQKMQLERPHATAEQITAWLRTVPPVARITVEVIHGDRPFDPSSTALIATWTAPVEGSDKTEGRNSW